MKQLPWLPISLRNIYKIGLITYNSWNGLAPHYIKNMLKPFTLSVNLRSSFKGFLTVPSVRLVNCGERSFSYAAPKLWNELPEYIRNKNRYLFLKQDERPNFLNSIIEIQIKVFYIVVLILTKSNSIFCNVFSIFTCIVLYIFI